MLALNDRKRKMIKLLASTNVIKFGEFTLASGETSSFYIDLRLLPSHPSVFKQIIDIATNEITQNLEVDCIDAIVGIPMAAIPFATLLSQNLDKPLFLLRKKTKDHGTKKQLEGKWLKGQEVLLIDDLITSGASKKEPIDTLAELGLKVRNLFVFINRSETSQGELEAQLGVKIHSIIDLKDLRKAELLEK